MSNEHPSTTGSSQSAASSGRVSPRAFLVVFALLPLAPALVHYRLVDHLLGTTRYPWGLIPIHFLSLRSLATLSIWLSIAILAAFGWSFRRPASTPRLLVSCAIVSIVFVTAYTCYVLFIVAILLSERNA